jgi:gluconokinase
MIIILMGVCGSGKTEIGVALSKALRCEFVDADDYHPLVNKERMRQGIALTDEDREPWLGAVNQILRVKLHQEQSVEGKDSNGDIVLACSALKEVYRKKLEEGLPREDVKWVYLKGDKDLIRKRMEARTHAYMPVGLLESQFEVLEEPRDALVVDVAESVEDIVSKLVRNFEVRDNVG